MTNCRGVLPKVLAGINLFEFKDDTVPCRRYRVIQQLPVASLQNQSFEFTAFSKGATHTHRLLL